jgi:hypothetical protein
MVLRSKPLLLLLLLLLGSPLPSEAAAVVAPSATPAAFGIPSFS